MDKEDAGMNLEDSVDTENHEDEIESFTDNEDNEVEGSHLETEVEEKTLEELKEENKTISDKMMRALAETENIRKKFFKERKDAEIYGGTKLARDILSVLDNLNRALSSLITIFLRANFSSSVMALLSNCCKSSFEKCSSTGSVLAIKSFACIVH